MVDKEKPPEESALMQSIRNFMMSHGGLGGADNHQYDLAMNVDPSTSTAKGYAYGGEVMPDLGDVPIPGSSFDVGNQSATMKTQGNIPPPPVSPALAAALAQKMAQSAPMQPAAAAPAPQPPPMRPPSAMPTMTDALSQAQAAGSQLYGQYSPEKRNELYAMLAQRGMSMPNAIGGSLASVGDAIAHGYGHDQTNFLDKTLQGQQEGQKQALDAFDTAQKGTLAQTSAGMDLSKLDPKSALSKVTVSAYAPILINKLGYTPAQVANMSAAQVEAVSKIGAEYGGKELENLFHQAQLIVENNYHKAEIGVREGEIKSKAVSSLAEHPIMSMLPTGANEALKQQAGLAGQTTGQAGAPQAKTINGKTYVNHDGQWYKQ